MATRIDYKVSVTPIHEVGDDTEGGGVKTDVIAFDWKKSLGGGNSSLTWAGNNSPEWTAGVNATVTSDSASGTTGAISGADGLWIRHTGYDYDAAQADNIGTTKNTANLTIKTGATAICVLGPGEAIFFPKVSDATYNFADDGTPCAVEYAIFT
jgi:hypothetical protein